MLEIADLTHSYADGHTAIDGLTLSVEDGSLVSLVGPSGCGKSTLLRCIAGLIRPTGGTVTLNGKPIDGVPDDLAVVFQDYSRSLFPWLTVRDNVALPLKRKGLSRSERREAAEKALAEVGLEGAGRKYHWQLSGGMQQRVAIARALAYKPSLLLMDEPFGAVDAQTREDLEDLVLSLHRSQKMTILLVTHDIDESVYVGDRVVVLGKSPAGVKADLPVDLPSVRDQIETRANPEFIRMRAEVGRLIRGGATTDAKTEDAEKKADPADASTTKTAAKGEADKAKADAKTEIDDAKAEAKTEVDAAKADADAKKAAATKAAASAKTSARTRKARATSVKAAAKTTASKAKADADKAKADAADSKTATDEAKASAGEATADASGTKAGATNAKADAAEPKTSADDAKTNTAAAKADADEAKASANGAKAGAGDAKASANGAKTDADDAKAGADDAKASADDAKANADDAKASADEAKASADDATGDAGDAEVGANDAKADADDATASADDAKAGADGAKADADCASAGAGDPKAGAGDATSDASGAEGDGGAAADEAEGAKAPRKARKRATVVQAASRVRRRSGE